MCVCVCAHTAMIVCVCGCGSPVGCWHVWHISALCVCVCVRGVCRWCSWVCGVPFQVGTFVPLPVCAHAWSVCVCVYVCARARAWSGACLLGCTLDAHLGPHGQVCECGCLGCRSPVGVPESTPQLFGNSWKTLSACSPLASGSPLDPCDMHLQAGEVVAGAGAGCSGAGLRERRWEPVHEDAGPIGQGY